MVNANGNVNQNFAVVHNCRCTILTEVGDFKLKKHLERDKSMIDYDDYKQWQKDQGK